MVRKLYLQVELAFCFFSACSNNSNCFSLITLFRVSYFKAVMTGNRFYFPNLSYFRAVNSHFFLSHSKVQALFPFSWDFHWVISISVPFPNTHSKTIKWKSTVGQQKKFHGKLDTHRWKSKILRTSFTILYKWDKNISTVILQNVMPVTVEYRNVLASEPGGKRRFSAVKHSRESVPVRIVVTAITMRTYVHFHSFPLPS